MIDKVVYVLSEGFKKEGLLVPFGTVYRIAEDLIAMQNDCSKEIIVCKDCKHYNRKTSLPLGMCGKFANIMRDFDFCSCGERRFNEQTD